MTELPSHIKESNFLVVDDYESMRIMIGDHLRQLGVQNISFAASGNEALKILQERHNTPNEIHIVLCDLVMENGSGMDVLNAVRANPTFKSLPLLMITSKAEVAFVLAAAKAGVSSYIIKPWELDDLAKKLIDVCGKKK